MTIHPQQLLCTIKKFFPKIDSLQYHYVTTKTKQLKIYNIQDRIITQNGENSRLTGVESQLERKTQRNRYNKRILRPV